MLLHNRLSKPELIQKLKSEPFKRRTFSFYRYLLVSDPMTFRDELYKAWSSFGCTGRIYIAHEGINAQMNVPEHNLEVLLTHMNQFPGLENMPIKWAIEDDGQSFLKLAIKVRPKIVADGLIDELFDTSNVGTHLSPMEFHQLVGNPDVTLVDMRNHYESEVGHFQGAICPQVETFREEVELVANQLSEQKDRKLLLYCTGGVRCEKASAWFKHLGFSDVNQLHGGIIAYASEMKQRGIKPKFIGKNFVFDERLGERITDDILSKCHQCGEPCDTHTNCAYNPCHELIIQCSKCAEKHNGCCSDKCHQLLLETKPASAYFSHALNVQHCCSHA
jgi:UPF0176 protein